MSITSPDKLHPILIGLSHISERSAAAIETLLRSSTQCQALIVAAHEAEILILDLDAGNPRALWLEFRQRFPTQPVIVLSLAEQHLAEVVWVKKPVKPTLLLEAITLVSKQIQRITPIQPVASTPINQITPVNKAQNKPNKEVSNLAAEPAVIAPITISNPAKTKSKPAPQTRDVTQAMDDEINHNTFGNRPDFDPGSKEIPAHVFYDPHVMLQGLLTDTLKVARADGKSRVIEGVLAVILVIPDPPGWVMTQASTQRIRAISVMHMANMQDTRVRELIEHEHLTLLPKIPLENFLWLISLSAARGRVPLGTDLHAPIKLERWPNFTRLEAIPHAMRISALWLTQAMSLLDTAAHLHIPQRYVFAFYSAANAIGIASIITTSTGSKNLVATHSTSHSGKPVANKQDAPKERSSFLGKLLNRLMRD